MVSYLVRRLLLGLFTLWMVTFLIYGLIRSMPGDPLMMQMAAMSPDKTPSQEDIDRQRREYDLDKPWYQAYGKWLSRIATGDLGQSWTRNVDIATTIRERIGPTITLTGTSLLLTYLIAVPLGLYSTVRSGRLDERGTAVALYSLYSLPSYVAALVLQVVFALHLQDTIFELPLFGRVADDHDTMSAGQQWLDVIKHAILPVTCFTYGSLAYYSRFIRANMQEVIRQDYIRTARAKGLGPMRVLVVHAFRNTLIPLVTMIGLTLPIILGGSVILEQIFSWPGMGKLFIESLTERDYPTIMALTLMFSVITLIGQLIADMLYAFVDPRITYH